MPVWKKLSAVAATLVMSGCLVPSIHPLYTPQDLVFDQALIGSWVDGDEIWTFTQNEGHGYDLTIVEDDETARLRAHLLDLDGRRFLDLYPEDPDCDKCWYFLHMLPVHTFCGVSVHGDTLGLAPLSSDWFEEKSQAGELEIAHELRDDQIILTADTKSLQVFILEVADMAFGETEILLRSDGANQ
ncbi:MAG: hypothetical protein HN712_14695 [Gemmatimonadetes bacterium]|nr:hypothetical protein [Gemmatimonadota bacterium]